MPNPPRCWCISFETLEAEYNDARQNGAPVTKQQTQQLEITASNLDQQTLAVDELALSWHAAYRLIEQCIGILRATGQAPQQGDTATYALVAVGGAQNLEAALEETDNFEILDRVCQSAVFFDGIDATLPNLKRMRAFDAMLKRNGYDPVFFELTEKDALDAGNQLAAFLYTRFGKGKTHALLAGKETLKRLGVEKAVAQHLAGTTPIRLKRSLASSELPGTADYPALAKPKEHEHE